MNHRALSEVLAALMLASTLGAAERVSYNGIASPAEWPPHVKMSREPLGTPSYLTTPPKRIPIDVGRQLFVDDFLIEKTTLASVQHRPVYHPATPVLKADKPWDADHAAPFSDGVWFDAHDGLFKMFYWARGTVAGEASRNSTCLATSKDGITWEKPELDIVPGTNIVMLQDPEMQRNSATVWLDAAEADPTRRFKMFQNLLRKQPNSKSTRWRFRVSFSPDGVHWTTADDSDVTADRSTVFYNPFRQVWVASLRRADNTVGRYRGYFESSDCLRAMHWETSDGANHAVDWTCADELDADRLDLPLRRVPERPWDLPPSQLYNLDCVGYESLLLGLFTICRGHQQPPLTKINEVCVGFSRDGFQWTRPLREAFCPLNLNQPGWNAGNLQSAAGGCVIVGDKLYFYVEAAPFQSRSADPSNVGLAILRRDGFTSLHAESEAGWVLTRPVTFKGRHLFVNADCGKGELRAEILDENNQPIEPFTLANCKGLKSDFTRAALHWKGADDLSGLIGRPVRFRFELTQGDFYAFWVSPEASGASHGYVAAGGPGLKGPRDDAP